MSKMTVTCFGAVLLFAATQCFAADPPKDDVVPVSSDKENYLYDKITYSFDKRVEIADLSVSPTKLTEACLPAYSKIMGKDKALAVKPGESGWLFEVVAPGLGQNRCSGKRIAQKGELIWMPAEQVTVGSPTRTGVAFGTLVIPFKYQYRGDETFSSGASLGGFIGIRTSTDAIANQWPNKFGWLWRGAELYPVAFLGATTTSVKETVGGQEKSRNLTGATYGLGFLVTVKQSFQLGVVFGKDRFDKDAAYANNNKTWVAATIGYTFAK